MGSSGIFRLGTGGSLGGASDADAGIELGENMPTYGQYSWRGKGADM